MDSIYEGAIGIDLGTTNSVISAIDKDGNIQLIPNKEGNKLTPSFIWIGEENKKLTAIVGDKAKQKMSSEPLNVLSSYKTHMGTSKVIKRLFNKDFTAIKCSALTLRYLKESAEEYLGQEVTKAVITVPAYFGENQKNATKEAARAIGLEVLRILDEPTAAAYHYLSDNKFETPTNVLCYDLGGGTFDVSIISIKGMYSRVLSKEGDHYLGGDNVDEAIAGYFLKDNFGMTLEEYKELNFVKYEVLIRQCEEAKIATSKGEEYILHHEIDGKTETEVFTKEKLIEILEPIINRTMSIVRTSIINSGLTIDEIHEVLLVGGSTRLPLIREKLIETIPKDKFDMNYFDTYQMNPDLCVGLGAGYYLKMILDKNEKRNAENIISKSIGLEVEEGIIDPIIKKGTQMPNSKTKIYANANDFDEYILLNIYEGDYLKKESNTLLGTLKIDVKPAKKNTYHVEVNIKVNKDGVVEAYVIKDNVKSQIQIQRKETESNIGDFLTSTIDKTESKKYTNGDSDIKFNKGN